MKKIRVYIGLIVLTASLLSCNEGKEGSQTALAKGGGATESTLERGEEEKHEQDGEASEENHEEKPGIVELTTEQFQTAGIKTGKLAERNLSNVLKVNGLLDVPPQSMASISTPLGGFVRYTELLPGSRVKKRQVIATIENPEFIEIQQEYLESLSRLEYLEVEYNRQQELYSEKVASAKNFQQVKADYKAVQARVSALKERLKLIGINPSRLSSSNLSRSVPVYSPITGYVTNVNVNIGKYVQPTDVMFTIANTEHLHVELTLFEDDVAKIKKGQKVRFILPNEGTSERTATIYLIGREIKEDRTVNVHAHMDKEDTDLLPGVYVTAYVELGGELVPALPAEAILQAEGKNYVFIPKGERKEEEQTMFDYQMIEIQTGVSQGGYTAVSLPDSLRNQNQEFVLEGAYSLLAKMMNSEEEGHGH
jgi:membrane fusion protein, heavy metal efflux system